MMVKICGITNRGDALAAADGGAAALGFNFYPRSPRYVAPQHASDLIHRLPAEVLKVGVFVNEPRDRVSQIANRLGLDVVQLHGDEETDAYPEGIRVWKAVRVREGFDPSDWEQCSAEALLLDGPSSGQTFQWAIAARSKRRIVIAGGLDAANVRQAIEQARPWGVDVCSRIESSPGRKDHVKMAEFLKAALTEVCA